MTPIQSVAIPALLQESDLMACAETGTGKTAAYLIPIVDVILKKQYFFLPNRDEKQICCPTALIILPTRELSTQVWLEGLKYSYETNIKMAALYGKTSVESQISKLKDANIVVATMGRLIHFFGCNYFDFSELRFFVIDEADKMLDLGFNEDIRNIFHEVMKQKMNKPVFQTALFSATYPYQIRELAADYLDNQIFVTIGRFGGSANKDIYQKLIEVDAAGKIDILIKILVQKPKKTLVFVDKKTTCDYVTDRLVSEKIHVTSIHGDRNQKEREDALRNFKKGKVDILIATSVASRGLDIPGVERVINYNLPFTIEEYIYRIGRTGRLGNKGYAISFYDVAVDSRLQNKLLQIFTECDQIVPSFLYDANLLWKKQKWDSLELNFDVERFQTYKLQCDGHHIDYKKQWY